MLQIRIHGRGGQGVVTAAEMLSVAAFLEGKHAQAFPSFGSERTGAPVVSFCRIDDKEIRLREPIMEPDVLIVQDPTLFKVVDVFQGIKRDGYLLVNSNELWPNWELDPGGAPTCHGNTRVRSSVGDRSQTLRTTVAERRSARRLRRSVGTVRLSRSCRPSVRRSGKIARVECCRRDRGLRGHRRLGRGL